MFRFQSLVFAAVLMSSATAFAADTPDPNAKGAAGLPSGSNAASPSAAPSDEADLKKSPPPTSPGQEGKGTPSINPQ
jgi:hypothetical protein